MSNYKQILCVEFGIAMSSEENRARHYQAGIEALEALHKEEQKVARLERLVSMAADAMLRDIEAQSEAPIALVEILREVSR